MFVIKERIYAHPVQADVPSELLLSKQIAASFIQPFARSLKKLPQQLNKQKHL